MTAGLAGSLTSAGVLQALAAQGAVFLSLLLAVSAVHKVRRWHAFDGIVRRFAGVPAALAPLALGAAVSVEAAAALLLPLPATRGAGAVLAAALLGVYLGLIVHAVVRGRRDLNCGCSFGSQHRPLGAFQILRNGLLTGLAVLLAVTAAAPAAPPEASQVLGGVALLALYGAFDQVMALQPLRRGEVS